MQVKISINEVSDGLYAGCATIENNNKTLELSCTTNEVTDIIVAVRQFITI